MHMEHFTAAQGAGKSNVGFGLEDPNAAATQAHPAHDFESFVSTHLGFEPEEDFGTKVSTILLGILLCLPDRLPRRLYPSGTQVGYMRPCAGAMPPEPALLHVHHE